MNDPVHFPCCSAHFFFGIPVALVLLDLRALLRLAKFFVWCHNQIRIACLILQFAARIAGDSGPKSTNCKL